MTKQNIKTHKHDKIFEAWGLQKIIEIWIWKAKNSQAFSNQLLMSHYYYYYHYYYVQYYLSQSWDFGISGFCCESRHQADVKGLTAISFPGYLKVVSTTFLLVCFLWLKKSTFEKQKKKFFISIRKLFSFLR